ncbi:MAG: helix-turn-helix domain-containing protein [Actinomycetota bacterium]
MTEIRKKDDLRSLIKELEERHEAETSGQAPSTTGFVSMQEAAQALKMDENALRRLVRKGELSTARIGRRKFISQTDLNRYAEKAKKEQKIKLTEPTQLLTVSEVAEILRFSEAQVYDMLKRRLLLGFRVGAGAGSWRVQRKDLDAYIATQREEALKER